MNDLVLARALFGDVPAAVLTAIVIQVTEDKVKVETDAGNLLDVWGSASVGDTVLIAGTSILGKVVPEEIITIYVP